MWKMLSLFLAVCLLAGYLMIPTEVKAASAYYNSYSDIDVIPNASTCGAMQGMAVGSQWLYTVKISSDETKAFISMTDKDTGETKTLYNTDAGSNYFNYLGHANDMDVASFDGKSHLFIATMTKGSNAIVRLKRSGTELSKFASYSLSYNGSSVSVSALAVKSVSNGTINFITKSGANIYTGSVDANVTSATIELSLLCIINNSKVFLKDQYYDLSDYVNQGMGYYQGAMFVPVWGGEGTSNRSVVMVYNLDNVIPGSTIYPSEALSFRITSSAYSSLFEIESCDVCSSDGKLYFNTNRRKSSTDTNHDSVSVFSDYTFVKLTEPAKYQHFVVQYDANGGSGTMDNSVIPYGVSTKLSANTFTRSGYQFAGWTAYRTAKDQWYYTNGTENAWYTAGSEPAGYTKYIYKDKQGVAKTSSVNEDTVIMYAQWTPNTYTVRYDANGGTGTMADTKVTYGINSALRKNTFVREGYTFAGWAAYRTAQNQWRYSDSTGTNSGWYEEGTQPEGYTLTVYSDGASVSKTTAIADDVTVFYAQWAANPYTITFQDDDGTVLQSTQVDYGMMPTPPDAPTKAQNGCTVYTFAGWDKELVAVTGAAIYTATYSEHIEHSWVDGSCAVCAEVCSHQWSEGQCSVCSVQYPQRDYYLFGYINGSDYACNDDAQNLGEYKFVDGKLSAIFTQDSYVALKSGDNQDWYMTESFVGEGTTSAILCNTQTGASEKLFVPGGKIVTFTLIHNGDDTFSLSYVAEECIHEKHDGNGVCDTCGAVVAHHYDTVTTDATCVTAGEKVHTCTVCGYSYTEVIPVAGHSYGIWHQVKVSGCTEEGLLERTCDVCGDVQNQTVSAQGHNYVDGICVVCGDAEVIVPTLTLDHPSLSFEGEIMYNLYFTADDLTSVVEMGLISFNEKLESGTIENADNIYPGYITAGSLYMGQSEGVPARYLGDAVYFKAYAKLSDGSYVYSGMAGYNAAVYAKSILNNSTNDYMKRLVVAMINYGAEAQAYFCTKEGVEFTPMNNFLTADQQALINAYDASMVADLISVDSSKIGMFTYNTGDFTKRSNSVSFDGAFAINYYFTAKGTPDNGMKFYYWNTADYLAADVLTPENATGTMDMVAGSGNQYWSQVSGIAAKEVDHTYFVAGVYELDGVTYTTGILAYSLGKYCAKLAAGTTEQQALSAATAVYGYYAKEYFSNI